MPEIITLKRIFEKISSIHLTSKLKNYYVKRFKKFKNEPGIIKLTFKKQ